MAESQGVTAFTIDMSLLQQASRPQASRTGPQLELNQLYEILPLTEPRCIRVLDLEAAPSSSTPLRGTIRVVDLQTSPEFTALSYVWGRSGSIQHTISCNGIDMPLTKSCHEALCALRCIYGAVTIWVDAICIHQGNDEEKGVQISLMREIYTWARAVYVWLGPGTHQSDKTIDWFFYATKRQPKTPGIPWVSSNASETVLWDHVSCIWSSTYSSWLRPLSAFPQLFHIHMLLNLL